MVRREVVQRRYIQRLLRLRTKRHLARGLRPGVTVVIVNWNTLPFLRVGIDAVRRLSPADTRVLVVDNRSHDGSRAFLSVQKGLHRILLPTNVGHELALDIGFLAATTEFVVSLDVDAFPVAPDWLERLLAPLDQGYVVSGAHLRRNFVHPCCLGMRLRSFVDGEHTFLPRRSGHFGIDADDPAATGWDTGGLISMMEKRRYLFDVTETRGPGDIGTVFGGFVYHNFYSARHLLEVDPEAAELEGVKRSEAMDAWREAVERFSGVS